MAVIDDVSRLYFGYFNRAPDLGGLNFWVDQVMNKGLPIASLAQIFSTIPVANGGVYSYFSAPLVADPVAFVISVYSKVLGRTGATAADVGFWVGLLNVPDYPKGRIIYDIMLAASFTPDGGSPNAQAILLNNKTLVSRAFTDTLVTNPNAVFKLSTAQKALDGVTTDPQSVTDAVNRNTALLTDVTAPVINSSQTLTFGYAENSAAGRLLGTVIATDNTSGLAFDRGVSGVSSFSIISGNIDGFFAIDASGRITLTSAGAAASAASNDFEKSPNSFTLGVAATDAAGNRSASANIILNVTNVDDTAPQFVGGSASGSIVRLNFDETLKLANLPGNVFTALDGNNTGITINSVAVNGAQVTLTLAANPTGTVKIDYAPPAAGDSLQDAAGNKVTATNVTLNVAAPNNAVNNLTLIFNDPSGELAPFESAIRQSTQVAWDMWAKHFTRTAPIELEINFMAGATGTLASARSLVTQTTGEIDPQGRRILQVGVAYELATGIDPNADEADGEIRIGDNLSNFAFRSSLNDPLPQNKFDAISVFAHEIGHILGFSASSLLTGSFVSSFERYITGFSSPRFSGPAAMAANGGSPVFLDPDSPSHLANMTDLMAASITNAQVRLVEPLHIAILQDTGVPISVLGAGGLV